MQNLTTVPSSLRTLAYRPEIDGLRALAVLPVLMVHAGFNLLPGGFLGVDIFFVISGFLIIRIIAEEIEQGKFSIIAFYERRARRILPALFTVLSATCFTAWIIVLPNELKQMGEDLIAIGLFVSNILFSSQINYFWWITVFKPLIHTWSLGVEEQFYILTPILFILLYKHKNDKKSSIIYLIILSISSIIFAEIGRKYFKMVNFYLLSGRMWEFFAGGLITFMPFSQEALIRRHKNLAQGISLAGLCAILFAYHFFGPSVPSPSLATILPVVGTVAIIVCATPATLVYKLLSHRIATTIGLISYSAYLWHQPIFAFAHLSFLFTKPRDFLILIVFTLILAGLTYRYIEQPFRNRQKFSCKTIFCGAIGGTAIFVSIGIIFYGMQGFPQRLQGRTKLTAYGQNDRSPYKSSCFSIIPENFDNFCIFGKNKHNITAIAGDSFGESLFWKAADHLQGYNFSLQSFTFAGCIPFYSVNGGSPQCKKFRLMMRDYIIKNSNIHTVVIIADWRLYNIQDDPYTISEQIKSEINMYKLAKKRIVLIYPIPKMPWDVPQFMFAQEVMGRNVENIGISYADFNREQSYIFNFLESIRNVTHVERILPQDILCVPRSQGLCPAQRNGMPLYYDGEHLNGYGVEPLAVRLLDTIRASPQN